MTSDSWQAFRQVVVATLDRLRGAISTTTAVNHELCATPGRESTAKALILSLLMSWRPSTALPSPALHGQVARAYQRGETSSSISLSDDRTKWSRSFMPPSLLFLMSLQSRQRALSKTTREQQDRQLVTRHAFTNSSRTMQPWSPPENAIVLTDLLRPSPPQHHQQYQPQQQRYDCVKQEPQLVPSRPRIVELPPLLPPRAPMLPAFSDVLRTTSPQHFQHENQETAASVHLYGVVIDKSSYTTSTAVVTEQYPTTFSATFMTRPHAADYHKSSGLVLPSLPATTSAYAITSGDMTPPGLVGARTRPIENVPPSPTSRPANRTCRFAGCTHYVVDHGLCVRHGGGKRCTAEGCTARAKHFGRCWRHGGSVECKAPECCNRAKSRGFCWSHGGGTKCKTGACEKIAISNGLCWAHGGGKRCIVPGCRKQAYERTCNYCNSHFQQYQLTALELARHNPSV